MSGVVSDPASQTAHTSPPPDNRDVGEVWSAKHADAHVFDKAIYWMHVPAVRARYNYKATGSFDTMWAPYWLRRCFPHKLPLAHTLSLGCGQGTLELDLAQLDLFQHCDAYDIAPGAIETARQNAAARGVTSVNFAVRDGNTITLPESAYDCVWFDMALHHIAALEHLCTQVAACLKPGGAVILNEYIGANRFDFPARQKELMEAAFHLLPERLRRYHGGDEAPQFIDRMYFPDPAAVADADPSEAIRSADIMDVLTRYFDVVVYRPLGGTLLQYVLNNIAGNFHSNDPASLVILSLLFELEDKLMEAGELGSDFALIVARRRDEAAHPFPHIEG